MRGVRASFGMRSFGVALAVLVASTQAQAFEFFDGRLQVHGYYEMTVRSIWEDFTGANEWDLTQWYHVLNLEIEADIAPDGFGPFDLVSAFSRVEVRYDCVWRRGCWMFPSVNSYGDEAKRLPKYASDGRRSGFSGSQFLGDVRRFNAVRDVQKLGFNNRLVAPEDPKRPVDFPFISGVEGFFGIAGVDGVLGTEDDPAGNTFRRYIGSRCVFGHQKVKGSVNGNGTRVLGPWDPRCETDEIGALRNVPNPFKATDKNVPVLGGAGGSAALPYRPAPMFNFNQEGISNRAQGLFYPSAALTRELEAGNFDNHDQNFSQDQLAWNHGASQKTWRELKELYFDLEMFDSRLWLRIGKQNIVWGKTELFRTTDQFNPQDLGLASLPSLEESRIALWAARGVWSFYEVGPLEDVRLEVAFNFDTHEPTDLGQCGEPYSPLPVCSKRFGLFGHGFAGAGIAGEDRPPKPWENIKGIEIGARVEFRWDRFSVAISDWYGYNDGFWVDRLFLYSRNVDPLTGRPRERTELRNQGRCRSGFEDACLRPDEALEKHSLNQQLFAVVCAGSVGFSTLDLTSCGQSVFNSRALAAGFPIAEAFGAALAGQTGNVTGTVFHALAGLTANGFAALGGPDGIQGTPDDIFPFMAAGFNIGIGLPPGAPACGGACLPTPLVPLSIDPQDGPASPTAGLLGALGVNQFLTDEQEALLGCGPFYSTDCDTQGIDLLNAEVSALLISWPNAQDATFGIRWDTFIGKQPGTVGFDQNAACTRFERGRAFILPGCRGPGDPGYTINKDGSTTGGSASVGVPQGYPAGFANGAQQILIQRVHPFTGQRFRSEMAVLSWNYLMTLVINSQAAAGEPIQKTNFDPNRPLRRNGCSFRVVQFCSAVTGVLAITGQTRPDLRAGGNGRFGRRDFIWAGGGEAILRYEKRNVLGVSVDFAEDTTKSNWSFEFTWIEDQPFGSVDEIDGNEDVDLWNLTVSVDRPTFINFLNANRTFFFNSQWFFQYINGHTKGHAANGPWNVFMTFAVSTGYFQDRLLPNLVMVYDFSSNSSALLPSITYRFNEAFSASFGVAFFAGRFEERSAEIRPLGTPPNLQGSTRNSSFVENGLSAIRQRDEVFLRIRYTF
ncbi:MAG: hypothetical protein QNK05_03235 [Myxococcota bacterium]|nr:hypothetical protein [Myxococcota bacterium]